MTSPILLTRAEISDLPRLAEIQVHAFISSPANTIFFRNWASISIQIAFFLEELKKKVEKPNYHCVKATNTESSGIEGYLLYSVEDAHDEPPATRDVNSLSSQQQSAAASDFGHPKKGFRPSDALNHPVLEVWYASTNQVRIDDVRGRPHIYLDQLYVSPESQGMGTGSLLTSCAVKEAQSRKLDVYLLSVPNAHEFYLKWGFVDARYFETDLRKFGPRWGGFGMYRFQGMWRESKSHS